MSEKAFQATVLKHFRARKLHCVKHNDSLTPGIPDLSVYHPSQLKTQWIELKVLPKLPKSHIAPVKFGFEEEQIYFLCKRNGFGLVKMEREVLLLPAYACTNKLNAWQLRSAAEARFIAGFVDWDNLVGELFR